MTTTDGDLRPRALAGVSEKIFRRHRERLAIVYIRQSTVQQVERHQEFDAAAIRFGRSRLPPRLGAGGHCRGR